MKSFEPAYLQKLSISNRAVREMVALGEFRGKQALWAQAKREVLAHLLKVAMIESAESSSRMERVEVGPHTLVRLLVDDEKPAAENRSQTELAGYRDALKLIHENAAEMAVTENVVRQLHGVLMKYTPSGGGNYKISPNDIVEKTPDGRLIRVRFSTVPPYQVEEYMRGLHDGLHSALQAGEVDPLILVPLYVHDLLCIHPFSDGNGRIARLMSVLLLHKIGYEVGRYISLERIIEESKSTYYLSLRASDEHWYEGAHDHLQFTEYFLGVALAAYRELEESTSLNFSHGTKKVMVEQTIEGMPATFRFAELAAKLPLLKEATIKAAILKMKADGKVVSEGRGRAAFWRKIA